MLTSVMDKLVEIIYHFDELDNVHPMPGVSLWKKDSNSVLIDVNQEDICLFGSHPLATPDDEIFGLGIFNFKKLLKLRILRYIMCVTQISKKVTQEINLNSSSIQRALQPLIEKDYVFIDQENIYKILDPLTKSVLFN